MSDAFQCKCRLQPLQNLHWSSSSQATSTLWHALCNEVSTNLYLVLDGIAISEWKGLAHYNRAGKKLKIEVAISGEFVNEVTSSEKV